MNFFIKFVPYGQMNKEIYRMPIQARDEMEAERITFALAIILDAEKTDSYTSSNGMTVYEKYKEPDGDTLYTFYVEWN